MFTLTTIALTVCLALPAPKTHIDPHSFMKDAEKCATCHVTDGNREVREHEFVRDISAQCMECHSAEHLGRSHPLGVDPNEIRESVGRRVAEVPEELPLDGNDQISCGTCHNPHLRGYMISRMTDGQKPAFEETRGSRKVAYYKSYYLRLGECGRGFDPLCSSCHTIY